MDFKTATTVFLTILVAELGDKTQLATLLFASDESASKLTVFFSASLALLIAVGIAVLTGGLLSEYVSDRVLRYVAGIGFIMIGMWSLITA